MKLQALLQGIAHETLQAGTGDDIQTVVIDSRKVTAGCLFICLRGLRADGHTFIREVAEHGATAVIVEASPETDYPEDLTVIKVENTRKAMSLLAANFYGRPAEGLRLIGVTGTNGKTSTTHFIETLLEAAGRKVGVIGTIAVRVGDDAIDMPFSTSTTPDPLELQHLLAQMRDKGAQDVVMEVSSHALSLYKMQGMLFDVAVFTNLTQDHLDFHLTMDNYRDAKAKLFTQCKAGVVNIDDDAAGAMLAGTAAHWLTYGLEKESDLQALHIEYLPDGSSFDVEIDGVLEHFYLPVKGRFNIYNALGAMGAALAMGLPTETIRRGVSAITGIPGRIQAIPNDRGAHVLVDYAHTPDGLVNVINAVREFTEGRVITVFGCGGDRDTDKRPMMGRIAGELSDYCILTSDNPRSEPPMRIISQIEVGVKETAGAYEIRENRRDAIFAGVAMLQPGDSLILAGKGHEHYQLVGGEALPFNDAEVAGEALTAIEAGTKAGQPTDKG